MIQRCAEVGKRSMGRAELAEVLRLQRLQNAVSALGHLGDYLECLGALLHVRCLSMRCAVPCPVRQRYKASRMVPKRSPDSISISLICKCQSLLLLLDCHVLTQSTSTSATSRFSQERTMDACLKLLQRGLGQNATAELLQCMVSSTRFFRCSVYFLVHSRRAAFDLL